MISGIELHELAEPRRQPVGAETQRRRDAQFAVRLLAAVDESAAHGVEFEHDVVHGAEQHFALFGQNEAARVAMKQRRAKVSLERSDLPAYRRLAETQRLARVGERPSVGGRLKDAQLIPVHERFLGPSAAIETSLTSFASATVAGISLFGRRPFRFFSGEPALGLERRHAAEARGRDRLAEHVVRDVAGGEHALDAGRGRPGRGLDIAV